VGGSYTANIILPLTIELSIKSLILKEGNKPKRTHNLMVLFEQLLPTTQHELAGEYESLSGSNGNEFKSFKILLNDHKNDFESWRYLDEVKTLKNEGVKLQEAICAILNVYNKSAQDAL
jgi:hypothetical protein